MEETIIGVSATVLGVIIGGLLQWWGTSREADKQREHEKDENALARAEQRKADQRKAAQKGAGLLWQEYERINNSPVSGWGESEPSIGLSDMAMVHVMLPPDLSDLFGLARMSLRMFQDRINNLKIEHGIDVDAWEKDRQREVFKMAHWITGHDRFIDRQGKTLDKIRDYDKAAGEFIASL